MLRRLVLAVAGAIGLVAVSVSPVLAASVTTMPTYTPGELVRFHHSPSVFLVDSASLGGSDPMTLHWIPNENVLHSVGASWSQVRVLSSTVGRPQISSPITLFRVQGSSTIYLAPVLYPGHVYAYPQPSSYPQSVPMASEAYTISSQADLPGTITSWPSYGTWKMEMGSKVGMTGLFQIKGQSAVYWSKNGVSYHWIPSAQAFNDSGFQWSAIQLATPSLSRMPRGLPMVLFQQRGHTAVYLLSHGQLHWMPSSADFTAMGYRWNEIQPVNLLPAPMGSPE